VTGEDTNMNRAALAALACVAAAGLFGTRGTNAAPVPPAKPAAEKWEYADLQHRGVFLGGGGQQGWAARWITADGIIEGTSWDDLGTKLKAPAAAKDAPTETHKLRILTHLGSEGWEMVAQDKGEKGGTTTWTFKRKVAPK
jgi:hypothetical protein